jgi:hypothetical protein
VKVLTAFCFVTGLALGGSDGPLFPWVNGLGGIIFLMIVPLGKRIEEK